MTLTDKKKALQMYKKEVTENQLMKGLLIEIIQILDYAQAPVKDPQEIDMAIGLIRSNINHILNK